MKKKPVSIIICTIMLFMCACGNQEVSNNKKTEETGTEVEAESTESKSYIAKIPMVMVNDQIYYATGLESILEERCGVMDGEIISSVDGTEKTDGK